MNYKIVLCIIILMLVILMGAFFLKYEDILLDLKEELIIHLESTFKVTLNVKELTFWPLNQLSFNEVEISTLDQSVSLSVPQIKVYYDIYKVLRNKDNPLKGVNYLKIEKPVVEIKELTIGSKIKKGEQVDGKGILKKTVPLQIEVEDGQLIWITTKDKLEFSGVSLLLKSVKPGELRCVLQSDVLIDSFQWENYLIKDLSLDRVRLEIISSQQSWQGRLQTNYINLEKLQDIFSLVNYSSYKLEEVKGKAKFDLAFSGEGRKLVNYQGNIHLENGSGIISIDDYIQKEEINDVSGEIVIDSSKKELRCQEFRFNLWQNPYNFNGNIKFAESNRANIFGHLSSDNFELGNIGTKLNTFGLIGNAKINLILAGSLSDPNINLDFSLLHGELAEQEISNLKTSLRYHGGFIYLDHLNFKLNHDNYFSAQGVYNKASQAYSLEIQGDNLQLALLQKYFGEQIGDFSGRVNTRLSFVGKGFDLANLSLSGSLEILYPEIMGITMEKAQAKIWLADSILLFQDGLLKFDDNKLLLSGEMNLAKNNINMYLTGEKIDLGLINKFAGNHLEDITGTADFKGRISNTLKQPLLELDVLADGVWKGNKFDHIETKLSYQNNILEIDQFKCENEGAFIEGEGICELIDVYPYLDVEIKVSNYSYISLEQNLGESLPLKGLLSAELSINGPLEEPKVEGTIYSKDTILLYGSDHYSLDKINLAFNWQKQDKTVLIKKLNIIKSDTSFTADGQLLEDNLKLDFILDKLSLVELPFDYDIKGDLSLTGQISGKISKPIVEGVIKGKNIKYNEQVLGGFAGKYLFRGNTLSVQNIAWQIGENEYNLFGKIVKLKDDLSYDLILKTENGQITDIINVEQLGYPFLQGYCFKGDLHLQGTLNRPSAQIDLDFFQPEAGEGKFYLKGQLGQELNLVLEGEKIEVSKIDLIRENIDINGDLFFRGKLTGSLDSYNLELATKFLNGRVYDYPVRKIEGIVKVIAGDLLYVEQKMALPDDSSLDLSGYIPIDKWLKNLDLKLNLKGFPLFLLTSNLFSSPKLEGYLDGSITINGSLNNPYLGGSLFLLGGGVDIGLPEKFSLLMGNIDLSGKEIKVVNVEGKYGDGPIRISGSINPFDLNDTWNLILNGRNLPFNYGSFDGKIDPDITIKGSLLKPLIEADVLTHELVIGFPFSWPTVDSGQKIFSPDLNMIFYPGDEVYLQNDNIDVLIQEGSFMLLYYDGVLSFEGELESEQGSFDYYNNKFILTKAVANFSRYKGLIPDLNLKAWTKIKGTNIEVHLFGPADNMITTFSSQPPLEEEEILKLLTSRGGLGEFVAGNLSNIISKEFRRIFADYLQFDFIDKIENSLKDAFSLDRLEIDSYNLGWEQEIVVYMGKYLNDKIYVQFSSILSPEEKEKELSFYYHLKDDLLLEGSWQGEDNYSLSIEKNLQF